MPDPAQDATLKDALSGTSAAAAQPAAQPTTQAAPTTGLDPAEREAADMGRIMLESGVTKEQINDLLAAPATLDAMRHLVKNNPVEFLNMLDRTDPGTAQRFHEAMANEYIKRHDNPADGGQPVAGDAGASLMREVQALREKVTQSETREQQREQAAFTAQVQSRYNSRVEDLLSQDGVKDLQLTGAQTKALRARLDHDLASDPIAVKRISNGNFVDVPKTFKTIVEEWASDNKKATEDVKAQRDRSSKSSMSEFASGAQQFMPPAGSADSWDATEEAFAAALDRAR
jgi:hypothetical protein